MKNKLLLQRLYFTDKSTIGDIRHVEKDFFMCNSLEDTVRAAGIKIYGKTAIPAGEYKVEMRYSHHFSCEMPYLLNVTGFTGIMFHNGSIPEHTLGCILTGQRIPGIKDFITNSKDTFNKTFKPYVKNLLSQGDLYVQIIGGKPAEALV